jgi:hypothetical protein
MCAEDVADLSDSPRQPDSFRVFILTYKNLTLQLSICSPPPTARLASAYICDLLHTVSFPCSELSCFV